MPRRKTKPDQINQPILWAAEDFPERQDLVEMVRRGFVHTGERVFQGNELHCKGIMEDILLGMSGRKVALKHGVSRNSIGGIRRQMELRGLVEPLKKEMSAILGNVILMGLEDYQDALAEGVIHPNQLPVAMGILMDKKLLLDGDPTVRIDQGKPSELTVESVQKWFDGLKRAAVVEVTSGAMEAKPA